MVTFIGGYSCAGKTKLVKRLMGEVKIPYFSIDYLKMGLFRSNKDCRFTPLDNDDHIANILWPIIREMAYTYIENGQNIVIGGCYIMPEQINYIEEKYKEYIRFVFIGFPENYIRDNFESGIIANKGVEEDRANEDERPISAFIEGHNELRNRALALKQKFYMIDGEYVVEFEKIYENIKGLYV